MNPTILFLSLVMGLVSWSVLLFVGWPWMKAGGFRRTFTVLAGVHLFRYVGLIALVPAHLDGEALGMSWNYLLVVGFGDFAAGLLAAVAIVAVRQSWRTAMVWAWLFAVVGTLDTLNAGPNFALKITDQNQVGAMGWLILTIYVPALVVTEAALGVVLYHEVSCWLSSRDKAVATSPLKVGVEVAS